MGDVFRTAGPRPALQVGESDGVVDELPLIEPRDVHQRQPGTPPAPAVREVTGRLNGDSASATVQTHEDSPETLMPSSECPQHPDETLGIVGLQNGHPHPPATDDQQGQDVHRPMPGLREIPPLDRTGALPADRASLQHSPSGHINQAHDPHASLGQSPGVGIAPQNLRDPILEPPIQPGRTPIADPERPEIDAVEEPPDGAGRDAWDTSERQPAANRPGGVRTMSFIVVVMRRLVLTLMLVAALASGGVLGMSKMGVDVLPPQQMQTVHTYADVIGTRATQVKDYVVGKFESYFQKHEEEHHSEHHTIVVTTPRVQDVTITESFVCQIRSQRHIEIRALEGGYLESIAIREGQAVKGGYVMFRILPILFQAKLEAEKAERDLQQMEYEYTDSLRKDNVVSQRQVNLLRAKLMRAEAKVKQSAAELGFTEVKAPFDGIVDRLLQREGSLIKEGDLLTTLSDNSTMWVYFNVPEKYYLEYMAHRKQHEEEDKIELMLANGDTFPQTGKIGAIEADFNNENGNIKFRADYPNPDRLLRHGQTGTIKIRRPFKNALVIPQRATFELLDKRYVKVIGEDGKVEQKLITIKNELEDIFVVNSGLKETDKIILEGAREVEVGEKVEYEFRKPEEALTNQKFHAE
jgi:membrane fusion protein, multidrug efflux system